MLDNPKTTHSVTPLTRPVFVSDERDRHYRFQISQDGLDRFSWPEGQAQGVMDFLVEYLRPAGLPDMDDFAVVPFHRGGDARMVGQPLPDGRPTIVDSLVSQADAHGVQDMIRQDCYEQMAV